MLQSTAVRKAARVKPADGVNGVIYYSATDNTRTFSTGLAAAIGLPLAEISLAEAIVMRIMLQSTEKNAALQYEPEWTWERIRGHLVDAATEFK